MYNDKSPLSAWGKVIMVDSPQPQPVDVVASEALH